MKKLIILMLALSFPIAAQETRREVVHSTGNPTLDTRPNSDRVSDVLALSGHLQRIVVLRFKTLANADKAFGGHLEPDTKVFTFAVVILGVLDDGINLTKSDDWTFR